MSSPAPLNPRAVQRLLVDSEPWLSCDDCFDGCDVAIEALVVSQTPLADTFRTHFAACPACLEEARSLAALIAPDHSLDPDEAVRHVDDAITRGPEVNHP